MNIHIGARVDILRQKRNVSMEELAEFIGVTHRNAYKVIHKDDMWLSQLWVLSEKLNYNFFELFTPNTTDGPKGIKQSSDNNSDLKKTKINPKEINFCVKYPPELANKLGDFMIHVNALANDMGFELG